jgi:hypothetical protein
MKQLKTILLTAALFAASLDLFSQPADASFIKPDYEQIRLNIEDTRSDLYYPKLWERYQQGDSTMTLEEKRHLLYGYVFQESYSPYAIVDRMEQIYALSNKDNQTKQEWEELVSLLDPALKTQPFNVQFLIFQALAYRGLDRAAEADGNAEKLRIILDALFSTGDGLSKETALHIVAVYQEYNLLLLNNFSIQSQALTEDWYDVLTLRPNRRGIEKLWFNISQPLNALGKLISE